MTNIPNPNEVFPNEFKTSCFIKNVITAPNIIVGDYTYYDDADDPTGFEKNNILFNYPEFGDRLVIGKFCSIASGTKFIMGPANHRISSVTTYPFNVFGGVWSERTPAHLSQLPFKGDIVIGNDVWFGRECVVMPGVVIGDGSIIAAYSVVTTSIPPYTVVGGNPARPIKKRFDDELTEILLRLKWWDLPGQRLADILPLLCSPDLEAVKAEFRRMLTVSAPEKALETQRLVLRKMTQADYRDLCAILQDEQVMYAYEGAFSDEEVQNWLDRQLARYQEDGIGLYAVVLKETGAMIGQCGLTYQDTPEGRVLEVGYLFQQAYWHHGYATEAARACKEYAFRTLGADRVCSIIRDTNTASQNVAKRNGMTVTGTFVKHYRGVDMPHYVFSVKRDDV